MAALRLPAPRPAWCTVAADGPFTVEIVHNVDTAEPGSEAVRGLREHQGCAPDALWHAPEGLHLLGGTVEGGSLLSCALPWGVTAAAARTGDGTVTTSRTPSVRNNTVPRDPTSWSGFAAAVLGVLRAEGALPGGSRFGVRLHLHGVVEHAAAPAARAAANCAALLAVADALGAGEATADPPAAAHLAHLLAQALPGPPPAVSDHRAVLDAASQGARLVDANEGRGRALPFDSTQAGLSLLVVDLPAGQDGVDAAEKRRRACERAAHVLGIPTLAEVEDLPSALGRLPEPALRNRLRHAVPEIHRVNAGAGLLRAGASAELGALLIASHRSQREYFADTDDLLDHAVQAAIRHGARGARTTAAAGGRRAVVLLDTDRAEKVAAGMVADCDDRGGETPLVRLAAPSAGARRIASHQGPEVQ